MSITVLTAETDLNFPAAAEGVRYLINLAQ